MKPADKQPSPADDELVLEVLPNGEEAWLKPTRTRRYVMPSRYWITDKGRAAIHAPEESQP